MFSGAHLALNRKIVHAPTKMAGNRPITIGYDFSTVSWVPELGGRWAPPLVFERISSAETPHQKGAEQLRRISEAVQALGVRLVSLWDSEYGCALFVNATHDIAADKLFRPRPNRCLWGPPPPYPGRGRRSPPWASLQVARAAHLASPPASWN